MIPKSQVAAAARPGRAAGEGAAGTLRLFPGEAGGGWAGRIDCRAAVCLAGEHAGDAAHMTADDDHPFDPRALLASAWASSPRPSGSCRAYCAATPARLRRGWPAGCPYHRPHPVDVPHGLDGWRVYELDGQVLLLGVDHTANATIHWASIDAPLPAQIRDPA